MILNITSEVYALTRYRGVTIKDLENTFEAYLYFSNEYKEHMIDDVLDSGLPLVNPSLLDYRDIDDYITSLFSGTEEKEINFLYKMMAMLERLDTRMNNTDVFNINIETVNNGFILDISSRGNVLELRYLDLLKVYKRKGFFNG